MNYNIPLPYMKPLNNNLEFDPMIKINMLEQEVLKLKNIVMTLEDRINTLEERKIKTYTNLNSDVNKTNGSLYML